MGRERENMLGCVWRVQSANINSQGFFCKSNRGGRGCKSGVGAGGRGRATRVPGAAVARSGESKRGALRILICVWYAQINRFC
jgi:hypothetical protein